MAEERPIRVLVAKPGLDGHDRGAKVIARILRDAGMEVVYSGLRRRIDEIVSIAEQEDVDVIGLSVMSGGVLGYTRDLMQAIEQSDIDPVIVLGGVITSKESPELKALGVSGVFPVGSETAAFVDHIREAAQSRLRA